MQFLKVNEVNAQQINSALNNINEYYSVIPLFRYSVFRILQCPMQLGRGKERERIHTHWTKSLKRTEKVIAKLEEMQKLEESTSEWAFPLV